MSIPNAPSVNLETYAYLFALETALRELIIESLQVFGPKWYKTQLPGAALDKYRNGRQFERKAKWATLVPLHPMYYIDFPHLREIILRDDNWSKVFKGVFHNKAFIEQKLSQELDFIRNKIAHNRKATETDLDIVRLTYTEMSNVVGVDLFAGLTNRCTSAPGINEELTALRESAKQLFDRCLKYEPAPDLETWKRIKSEWWFDDTYLGQDLNSIEGYFGLLETYSSLPRRRGMGHKIEEWVSAADLKPAFEEADREFSALLGR